MSGQFFHLYGLLFVIFTKDIRIVLLLDGWSKECVGTRRLYYYQEKNDDWPVVEFNLFRSLIVSSIVNN